MARKLIVTGAFDAYERGAEITDVAEIDAALANHRAHVVAVAVEDPAPAAPPPPPAAKKAAAKTAAQPAVQPAAPAADDDPGAVA